jgi:hypothetical protein
MKGQYQTEDTMQEQQQQRIPPYKKDEGGTTTHTHPTPNEDASKAAMKNEPH